MKDGQTSYRYRYHIKLCKTISEVFKGFLTFCITLTIDARIRILIRIQMISRILIRIKLESRDSKSE